MITCCRAKARPALIKPTPVEMSDVWGDPDRDDAEHQNQRSDDVRGLTHPEAPSPRTVITNAVVKSTLTPTLALMPTRVAPKILAVPPTASVFTVAAARVFRWATQHIASQLRSVSCGRQAG